jgi:nitrate/TMAO reductase-like tetraheme cytochrome c subunit
MFSRLRALVHWLWGHKLITAAMVVVLGLVGAGSGTAVGLTLEESNEFCASCHTQPEYDFWARTQAVAQKPQDVADLATFHIVPMQGNKQPGREALKCISCHGGPTLPDRIETATTLGALDTIKFVALDIKQPAKLSHPLPNSYCMQCHQSDVDRTGFDNHFHNKLTDPKAPVLNCTSCHVSHAEADVLNKFILREAAYPNCNACHKELGGPTNLK